MTMFSFFFGLQLGCSLYAVTDNLSKVLQDMKMSAILGQRLARLTSTTEAVQYEHIIMKGSGLNMVEEQQKESR